jgi:transcriptional regulator with XRE-family HTH domain
MNGEQIRAARALIGWSASELAEQSGISYPTIQRLDATRGKVSGRYETIEAIRKTLEDEGIQFLENGETALGFGVVLKGKDGDA